MNELSRVQKIKRGIEILLSYEGAEFCAEHDQIWAGPSDMTAVSTKHQEELAQCGWFECADSNTWTRYT